jgi:hypothetical protein
LVHPLGSGGLVQAEGFGEDSRLHLGGEVEERGPAAEDVTQGGERIQAEPFRDPGHQPVDLLP